jgi:cytochrome b
MADESAPASRIRIWDAPTRIFHWSLAGLIAYLWWTEEHDEIAQHKLAGYAVIGLVVFRLYWGFFGSQTARFADFVKGPRTIWHYLRGRAPVVLGHNPLGALSVIALLALVAVEATLGLFAIDEDGLEAGPLAPNVGLDWAQWAAHWHALLFNALLALVALHVVAIALYWLAGNNLLVPMFTGRKRLAPEQTARFAPWWSAAIGIGLAAVAAFALWRLDT